MSWPIGKVPLTEEPVFLNGNGRHIHHGQVSNIDTVSMVSLDLTFPPPVAAEAPILSNMNVSHLHHRQEITPIAEQNILFGSTPNQENEIMNPNVENSPRSKRRKLKSMVWNDFTKNKGEDGKEWAKCNHCQKKFVGSSKSGTTHLKNHLERCPSKGNTGGGVDKEKEKCMIDQELNGFDMVRKIIKNGLNSIKGDILNVYQEEKEKLSGYFNKLSCRFSLSIYQDPGDNFFLVLCFIDDSWELKKRIIYFQRKKYKEDILESVLVDLSIDKNIFSIVNDTNGYEYSQKELIEMSTWFSERGSISFFGIFTRLSQFLDKFEYSMDMQQHILSKVRKLRDYVRCTLSNENFQIAVDKAKSIGKKVTSQGVPISSSFQLLEWVIGFKDVFSELEHIDLDFKLVSFIKKDWNEATSLYKCWKLLKDVDRSLSNRKYKTLNIYFPIVCDLFLKLVQWENSDDQYCYVIASDLREDFDTYWSNTNLILAISAVLDPRFKMKIVKRWYKEIYGDDADVHINKVIVAVTDIYNEYAKEKKNSKSSSSWDHGDINSSTPFKMLDAMGRPCTSAQHVNLLQSELDRYLKDPKYDRVEEFDILTWWRVNYLTYPTLARMAYDFLALPLCTYEIKYSLISQIDNIINDKNLDDDIKQPLICTKVWLYDAENK